MNGWFGVALVLLLVAAAVWIQRQGPNGRTRNRRVDPDHRERVQALLDLPQKAQFELMKFYEARASTLPLDVASPAIAHMLARGILRDQGGVVAVTEEFAAAMKDWIGAESRRSVRGSYKNRG